MSEYKDYYNELHTKQFSEEELEKIMEYANKKDVYRTQKLTPRFIYEYILNPDYDWCVEDSYICLSDVMPYQKHLTLKDISDYIKKAKNVDIDLEDLSNLNVDSDSFVITHSGDCVFVKKTIQDTKTQDK